MKKARSRKKPVSVESVARMADHGKDVSRFLTNSGNMTKPIQRVNVDFTASMLEELETAARELNISRQAVIKTLIRQDLDQRQTAHPPAAASRRRPHPGRLVFQRCGFRFNFIRDARSSARESCVATVDAYRTFPQPPRSGFNSP